MTEEVIRLICQGDSRFSREAYFFVEDALDFTMRQAEEARKKREAEGQSADENRHVTGRDLLSGIFDLATQRFGPLSSVVFQQWGLRSTEDFGQIVFNMVDAELMSKQDSDTLEDFKDGFDFETAFDLELDLRILD